MFRSLSRITLLTILEYKTYGAGFYCNSFDFRWRLCSAGDENKYKFKYECKIIFRFAFAVLASMANGAEKVTS